MSSINAFSIVPVEVCMDKRLTLEQMRVLVTLLSFRNKNTDTVWPSRAQIAERCGMHESNISAATTALVNLGWLVKDGQGGFSKSSRYRITVPDLLTHKETIAEQATSTIADKATVAKTTTVAEQATPPLAESATRMPLAESATRKELTNNIPMNKPRAREDSDFEVFWKAYPKKVGKEAARKSWLKICPPVNDVIKALEWQVRSEQWRKDNGAFIPYPTTYLNQGRWKDEPTRTQTTASAVFNQEKKKPHTPLPKERVNRHIANMHDAIGRKARSR